MKTKTINDVKIGQVFVFAGKDRDWSDSRYIRLYAGLTRNVDVDWEVTAVNLDTWYACRIPLTYEVAVIGELKKTKDGIEYKDLTYNLDAHLDILAGQIDKAKEHHDNLIKEFENLSAIRKAKENVG